MTKTISSGEVKERTVYRVQLMRGTDNAYDETFEPETLLTTFNKQVALDFYEML